MSRAYLATLALAATVLAASGCGSSTKSTNQTASSTQAGAPAQTESSAPSGPLTRTALIAKADAICGSINAKRAPVHLKSTQDYVRYLPQVVAYEQAAIAELEKLTPPPSMATDWELILTGNRIVASSTAKIIGYAKANNIGGARGLVVSATQAQEQMIATARKDGFKDCAKVT